MDTNLQKIEHFIQQHHVMGLATHHGQDISVCSLFYAYNTKRQCFVVASALETTHIKHIMQQNTIAGNIVLETEEVGRIQGLQFQGIMKRLEDKGCKELYFNHFGYARVLVPTLWEIEVDFFKLTDNRLGFGKKILWRRSKGE